MNSKMLEIRRGKIRIGIRTANDKRVEAHIVPNTVVVECPKAPLTIAFDELDDWLLRKKYQLETVPPVVARTTPLMTERVQTYIRKKNTASHQVAVPMTKADIDLEK